MKKIWLRVSVVLYLFKMNRQSKVAQGNATRIAIENDPARFPVAQFSALTTALKAKTDALSLADAATGSGSRDSFAAADLAEQLWDNAMRNVAFGVQTLADANPDQAEEIVRLAALRSRKASQKTKPVNPVQDFSASVTGRGTAILLKLISDNARNTRFEILMTATPDDEKSWAPVANTTARKAMVQGLTNGTRYYFKVRAINNFSVSDFSNVITQIAA
jgi:hypothetical protein